MLEPLTEEECGTFKELREADQALRQQGRGYLTSTRSIKKVSIAQCLLCASAEDHKESPFQGLVEAAEENSEQENGRNTCAF